MRKQGAKSESSSLCPLFEALEPRTLLSASVPVIGDLGSLAAFPALVQPDKGPGGGGGKPVAPQAYTPAQIRAAYGIPDSYTGVGQTIAIIDAYDDPNIVADLNAFDARYFSGDNDPDPKLTVYKMADTISGNTGWGVEISLDVEWAYAIAPDANILLVEAKSNSLADLLSAVDYASSQPDVVVVSMSWGSSEFASEASYDWHFTTPGITYVASSGDRGGVTCWPAVSPNVVAVGGTTLTLSGSTYVSETGWNGSGGGVSKYELKPSYQSGVTQSKTMRTNPDVAYDADPNTGFMVYDTYGYGGWLRVGGTSAGAPQWAALVALADQARGNQGSLGSLDTLSCLYTMPASNFHDITSGNAGKNRPGSGYDLVTGIGSPYAFAVISALAEAQAASASAGTATGAIVDVLSAQAAGLAEVARAIPEAAPSAPAPKMSRAEPAAADLSYASALDVQAIAPGWTAAAWPNSRMQEDAAMPATPVAAENAQAAVTDLSALPADLLRLRLGLRQALS